MRTRIALVAIVPIALITVISLTQIASVQSAQAVTTQSSGTASSSTSLTDQLVGFHNTSSKSLLEPSGLLLDPGTVPPASQAAPTPVAPPVTPVVAAPAPPAPVAAPAGPVDTVTPEQRAAWERVAMCEEGGDWSSDGSRFSGGLGITRTNWAAYGGEEFAPEGAEATEDQQIMVAERIQSYPPDQGGCHGW
jgi:Transglycosylase-like domain